MKALGGASFHGSMAGQRLNRPLVGMTATTTGHGYWLVASDGGLFSFGDARFFGSTGATTLAKPIVGMAATSTGAGYWLVASDGGVFAFGDARFFGSTGAMTLRKPIVGMAATSTGAGYWLVASDGGIFAFGDARFFGSTGAIQLNQPVVGMTPSTGGSGYRLVAADGGMFSFGTAAFYGALGGQRLTSPVVGSARTSEGGYVLVQQNGAVTRFGPADTGPGGDGPAGSDPTGPVTTDGTARLSTGAVRPGGKVSLSASGFRPVSPVRIELHSDPVLLGEPEAAIDGTVSSELTIPPSTPEGSHHVVAIGVDPDGKPITKTLPLIVDFDGFEVVSLEASPGSVAPGDTVTLRVHVTDASGVSSLGIAVSTPSGSSMNWCSGYAALVSGTAQDGVWAMTCTVPQVVSPGTYTVTAWGSDVLSNWQGSNTPNTTFTITGGGPVDMDGFEVVSLEASPGSVAPGDTVTLRVHVTDASGVSSLGIAVSTPSGSSMNWCSGYAALVSGTAQDGVWAMTCTVPQVVSPGTYTVTAWGSDVLSNWQGSNTPNTTFTITG